MNDFSRSVYISIHHDDVRRLFRIMETELALYNHIIEVFSAQLNRDYKVLLGITPTMIDMFGDMCVEKFDIYELNEKKFPKKYMKYLPTIREMTSMQRFIFMAALKNITLLDDVKRRMGRSILHFFANQAEIKNRGSLFITDEEILKNSYETLSPTSIFNKKHIQISKKDCKVETDDAGNTVIRIPYAAYPISVKTRDIYNKNWNYLILHQEDKITTQRGAWVVEFKHVKSDDYFYKKIDRLGKSSIVEITKNRTR